MLGTQGWQCWMQNGGAWSQELQDTRPYENSYSNSYALSFLL